MTTSGAAPKDIRSAPEADLHGKVAFVSGASRGIGESIARALAGAGAKVVVAARSEREADPRLPGTIHSVVAAIREVGATAEAIPMDVGDPESIASAVRKAVDEFGRLDILVNNAAVMVPGPVANLKERHLELMWQVNLRGPLLLSREVLEHMPGAGHIINISIPGAHLPGPGPYGSEATRRATAYVMLKAGLERLTQALAAELDDAGIAVNALVPNRRFKTPGNLWAESDPANPRRDFEPATEVGRAVVMIASRPVEFTGHILTDTEVLAWQSSAPVGP